MYGCLLLILLALPSQAVTYSIDSKIPYRKNLHYSIQKINRKIGSKVFVYSKDNPDIKIIWDETIDILGWAERGDPCIAHVGPATLVFNGKKLDQDFISVVGIHELGHCLGLEHNDNPDSIMYVHPLPNTKILKSDILLFREALQCMMLRR